MTMNSSGPISLGGATTGQSINLEIGSPATSTVSLNDTLVRTLAGVVSGTIVVPTDFYGKSISSAYFQVFTSPTGSFGSYLSFDPAGNYFIRGSNVDVFCDSTGNITSSKIYTSVPAPAATANYWSFKDVNYVSEINPNNLIMAGRVTSSNPPTTTTRSRGGIGVFNNSTNTFNSKTWRYAAVAPNPNPNPSSMFCVSAKDFPNGNIVGFFGSSGPSNRNAAIVTFDSSLNQLSHVGFVSNSTVGAGMGIIKKVSPTTTMINIGADNLTNKNNYTVFLDNTSGSVTNVWQYTPQVSAGGAQTALSYGPTNSIVMQNGTGSPAGGDNKVLVGRINNSPLSYTQQKKFPGAGGTLVGINQVYSLSDNFSTSNKAASCVGYSNGPSAGSIVNYLIDIDNTLTINNRWSINCNGVLWQGAFNNIQYKDGYAYLLGNYSTWTFLLKIPEDFSTIASGLTATAAGLTLTLTPVSDPGYLNLIPHSLSITSTSLSPLSFTLTGTPNDFTYTSGAIASTKISI